MSNPPDYKDIPSSERTPLVEWLLNIISEQQKIIDKLSSKVCQLELHVENLDEQLLVAKKLKGQPKIRPSTLNETEEPTVSGKKRAGSEKRREKMVTAQSLVMTCLPTSAAVRVKAEITIYGFYAQHIRILYSMNIPAAI